jgi:chorismate mutase
MGAFAQAAPTSYPRCQFDLLGFMDAAALDSLRQEIDAIDTELHGLFRRRTGVVERIAGTKTGGGVALRPGREAVIMRRRLAAHDGSFPAAALFRIWREMMSAYTLMQTPGLRIAICRPVDQPGYWDLARDHFGCQIPFVASDTPAQVLAAVRANATTLGVVPAPIEADTAPWWPLLASGEATLPNVVARLPFLPQPNARARGISALVLARIEPEASGEDMALLSVETPAGVSRARIASALAKAGLPPFTSALDQVVGKAHHYLVELPGVFADRDPRLKQLEAALGVEGARVASIGAYATPVPPRT